MRVLLVLLLAAVLGAGCLAPGAPLQPVADEPTGGHGGASGATTRGAAPEDEPTFCESEEGCLFWDDDYHEFALYDVDTYEIDVLIVPSASPDALEDTRVMRAAVDAWAAGIAELGEAWFAESFRMNVYTLGTDTPPQSAMEDPELVVLAAEYNPVLLFGIGLEPKQLGCTALGQQTLREYPAHAHGGMSVYASDCTGIGFTCFAVNTNFLAGSYFYLQDLVAHEVGHCLGGGHVGDALDFAAKRVPVQDVMSYQHDDDQVHCVSDLNVRVLEALYAPLLGQTVATPLSAGDYLTMPRAAYDHVACENP